MGTMRRMLALKKKAYSHLSEMKKNFVPLEERMRKLFVVKVKKNAGREAESVEKLEKGICEVVCGRILG